jgi:hypothetical protein
MIEMMFLYAIWCIRLFVAVGLLACTITIVKFLYNFVTFAQPSVSMRYRY